MDILNTQMKITLNIFISCVIMFCPFTEKSSIARAKAYSSRKYLTLFYPSFNEPLAHSSLLSPRTKAANFDAFDSDSGQISSAARSRRSLQRE